MSGALKAAWGLTAFVVVAGVVLWLVTGKVVFIVFIALGVLTAIGAVVTGRAEARSKTPPAAPKEENS
jgi:ABC-type bacteriocin/lantibiotic exporter with double-glycine peptidase domain